MSTNRCWNLPWLVIAVCAVVGAQSSPRSSSSSSSSKPAESSSSTVADEILGGSIANGVYRNNSLSISCRLPAGWVLRTEAIDSAGNEGGSAAVSTTTALHDKASRVLLAAFSRPPEARAEDVNASILIAAENAAAYPGLKEAAQYFGPLTEVAKAQGFEVAEDPYEFAVGTKMLVRGDFHKDVGTRVMRQSTLAMLVRGYLVSFTFIGGTEDEVEELVQGLSFPTAGKAVK